MRVEVFGGPHDGRVVTVEDAATSVVFVIDAQVAPVTLEPVDEATAEATAQAVSLPIRPGRSGRPCVVWPRS